MVVPDDFVTPVLQQTGQTFTDDGRTDMSDVHLLGGVGRGVVQDDFPALPDLPGPTDGIIASVGLHPTEKKTRGKAEVDEARTRQGHLPILARGQSLDQLFRQGPRVLSLAFGKGENAVGLKIAETLVRHPDLGFEGIVESVHLLGGNARKFRSGTRLDHGKSPSAGRSKVSDGGVKELARKRKARRRP